jgi:hypothetical protein
MGCVETALSLREGIDLFNVVFADYGKLVYWGNLLRDKNV